MKLSGDRKVSALCSWHNVKGKQVAKPKVKNAFGLPAGDSCPGRTEWCESCYAEKLQKAWTNVDALVWHNLNTLLSCGSNVPKMTKLLDEMVKSVKWYDQEKVFRWMWNGDIFSSYFARSIVKTCDLNPDIQFWLYTRSFKWVNLLYGVPNLTVYLSVDEHNLEAARKVYNSVEPGTVWVAAGADSWEQTEEIMRDVVGRNAPRCPELTGKLPMVTADGKGACVACGMCIKGVNHVRFAGNH